MRTHTCGELRKKNVGKEVTLCGWVQSRRDHGGIIFVDLRDRYGLTQVVFDPAHNKKVHEEADKLRREWVIKVTGKVRDRKKGMINPKMKTGEIEIIVNELEILNESETPPIEIDDNKLANEEMRLKYRYLDLRRPQMQANMALRHKVKLAAWEFLDKNNFLELETPILIKPTPEGARDFLVPSRLYPGKFYALPQSPQLYKQTLMVSGFDRYFQIARCLRDEDLRGDRQFEHTQIDMEMSFIEQEDIQEMVSKLMIYIWKKVLGVKLKYPFPKLTYYEAMNRFGSDKPDLRFGLELCDLTEIIKQSNFEVFKKVIEKKGIVKCLRVPKGGKYSRKDLEELEKIARTYHAKGLVWFKVTAKKELESSMAKFFNKDIQSKIIKETGSEPNDLLLLVADKFDIACNALGQIRLFIGQKENLIKKNEWKFCWIIDFPMFEWNEELEKWEPKHHPFCMPKKEHLQYLEKDPGKVLATLYDLVLNGAELCSGSIRINRPHIQERVLKVIGMDLSTARKKFGFLIDAFKYGAPPHGGVGLGLDRIVAMMIGITDIKEVICFPKNKAGQNPMDGCPIEPDSNQLKELHIKVDIVKK